MRTTHRAVRFEYCAAEHQKASVLVIFLVGSVGLVPLVVAGEAVISTVPEKTVWVADGTTEHRLEPI